MTEAGNPRRHAQRILVDILRDRGSLNQLDSLSSHPDSALIQALAYGVCRHCFELMAEAGLYLNKPLRTKDSDVLALILLGLYQLRHMRMPDHAVIHETVACVRKPWARGLVNAVLREAQRRGPPIFTAADDPQAASNHPAWLLEALGDDWPDDLPTILQANNERAPLTLRVNLLRTTREDYLTRLGDNDITAMPGGLSGTAVILDQPMPVTALPGFGEGLISVQDEASQLAGSLLPLKPGLKVLDACAAPGGKTAALLEREPRLSLLALDSDADRLQRVTDNLMRLQLDARVHCADAREWAIASDERFDRILLDAPCSGTGVIRRHPDIRLLRSIGQIERLCELQAGLLDALWRTLERGGQLLYTTCSVLKRENTQQIQAFVERTADARLLPLPGEWGTAQHFGRQLLPGVHKQDGFFYALLEKC